MPKKSASARGGASRNKPKLQKNVQLVRPAPAENDIQDASSEEETPVSATPSTAKATTTATVSKPEIAKATKSEVATTDRQKEKPAAENAGAGKGSAAARLAARRETALRQQVQRNASLITSEHYAYVRRDLIYIAVLAVIFFTALIVLHFVPAIGG